MQDLHVDQEETYEQRKAKVERIKAAIVELQPYIKSSSALNAKIAEDCRRPDMSACDTCPMFDEMKGSCVVATVMKYKEDRLLVELLDSENALAALEEILGD